VFFNSPAYGLFLVLILVVYYRVPHRVQNALLLAASYTFYAFWDPRFLALIWLSTVVDFVAARVIGRERRTPVFPSPAFPSPVLPTRTMRFALAASVATNLGILGFFKYWGFFAENAQALLATIGFQASMPVLEVLLPVGISFYTFQTLSYTIDVYRGEIEPVDSLTDFALFVAYFPQLVAGPIERAGRLLPQIRRSRHIRQEDLAAGLTLILMGLVRKVAIADPAGVIADRLFAEPARFTPLQLTAGMLAYGLQIYGDFAGYSNIARGSSRLLGIELMRNFKHPYFATNPADFWRRWHISLSTWLRDYVYIPLGGNRRGRLRTDAHLMATMLVGGLWHGASWRFVVWGGLHGVFLGVHRRWTGGASRRVPPRASAGLRARMGRVGAMLATFVCVHVAWVFFRARDLDTALIYLSGLVQPRPGGWTELAGVVGLGLLTLGLDLPQHALDDELWPLRLPPVARGVLAATAVILVALSGTVGGAFIYFQF
jgi:D-alanyl-lipoteichoic acid acyltransferase DltB (MBOAT superfamily)